MSSPSFLNVGVGLGQEWDMLTVWLSRYLVYIGFSARAVDVNRKLKRQSSAQLDDGVNLVPIKKADPAVNN